MLYQRDQKIFGLMPELCSLLDFVCLVLSLLK